jgi:hypothetical protein
MKITPVKPVLELEPFIQAFWVFESPFGFPTNDRSIVAPNGCSKPVIPYENSRSIGASSTNICRRSWATRSELASQ